jgi:small-conductance mechanosensitive channel
MSEVSERLAANVVTSENLAEFNAKRMGLADSTPSEAVEKTEPQEVDQGQSEPTEAENDATATEDRKQNPKLERRFSEITKQREAAREEARREREARENLEAKVRDLEAQISAQS